MSSAPPELASVPQYFDAIADAIRAGTYITEVANYEDFDDQVADGAVLIEFETAGHADTNHEGRFGHRLTVTLHCVMSRARPRASLDAADLALAMQRLVDNNRWGFSPRQVKAPTDIRSEPSMFKADTSGTGGYDAWGCSFEQIIHLGPVFAIDEDDIAAGAPMLSPNPGDYGKDDAPDLTDPGVYRPLSCGV